MKPDNSSKRTQTTSEAPPHKRTPTLPLCQLRGSDLKAVFLASNRQITVDVKQRENTLNMLREEILTQKNRPLQSRGKLLLCLLRYTDRNLPGIHLLGCVAMLLLLFYSGTCGPDLESNARIIVFLSMTLPCFLVFLSAAEIRQICFTGIAELNETCFFHVRQLAALSMAFSSILNLIAVSAGILLVSFQWKVRLIQIGLYVLVPFIFMQCICFGCMLTETGRRHIWLNAVLTLPLAMLCVSVLLDHAIYAQSALFIWAIALLAGIVILAAEMKLFFARLEKGDILCTN